MNPIHDAPTLPAPLAPEFVLNAALLVEALQQGEQGLAVQVSDLIKRLLDLRELGLRTQHAATLARTSLGIVDGRGDSVSLNALTKLEALAQACCGTALHALGQAAACGETVQHQILLSAQATAELHRNRSLAPVWTGVGAAVSAPVSASNNPAQAAV